MSGPFLPYDDALGGDVDAASKLAGRLADGEPRADFACKMLEAATADPAIRQAALEALLVAWRSREANYCLTRHLTPIGVAAAFERLAPTFRPPATKGPIKLYRGVKVAPKLHRAKLAWWYGTSWTTSFEGAAFFACDYWMNVEGQEAVAQIEVSGTDIAFHLDDGEDEFILRVKPTENLRDPAYARALYNLRIEGRRGLRLNTINQADIERWRTASSNRRSDEADATQAIGDGQRVG